MSYLPLDSGCGWSVASQSLGGRRITACHSFTNLVRQAPRTRSQLRYTGLRLCPLRMKGSSLDLRYSHKSLSPCLVTSRAVGKTTAFCSLTITAYRVNVMSLILPFAAYENRSVQFLRVCVCNRLNSPGSRITS